MLELSIPQPGKYSKQAKDLIFTILTNEKSQSIIQLYNQIKKNYNISITYQAVRKAVEGLYEQEVLVKFGKQYSLSKDWVFKLKGFFDTLLSSFNSGKRVHSFSSDLVKDNYVSYTLNSLFELATFWGDILVYLAKSIKPGEEQVSINYGHYTWWMLTNLGEETSIYDNYDKKGLKTYFLWLRDLPLNRWSSKIYSDLGYYSRVLELDDVDECISLNTVGDTVLEVKYSSDILLRVKKYFEKYSSQQDMSMKEITDIAHANCVVTLTLIKNKELAKSINEKYLKYFKQKK